MSATPRTIVKISSPVDILGVVPHRIGFHPDEPRSDDDYFGVRWHGHSRLIRPERGRAELPPGGIVAYANILLIP